MRQLISITAINKQELQCWVHEAVKSLPVHVNKETSFLTFAGKIRRSLHEMKLQNIQAYRIIIIKQKNNTENLNL